MHQQRSTKGASKQRRDCINVEINQIKDVLPVSENVRRRLSQLQVMALCNSYIAKSNCFLNALSVNDGQGFDDCSLFDFSEALPGFLLAITSDGKLLYISENVTEYLGHSMVELMTQADSIYDILDRDDQKVLRDFLVAAKIKHDTVRDCSRDELDFTCRVNLARLFRRNNVFDRQKMIKIHGRFIWPEGELHLAEPIFVARCSPVLSAVSTEQPTLMDTTIFHTSHSLDMKYMSIEDSGEFYLGYHKSELVGTSWYQLVHPDDTQEACRKHSELIQGGLDAPRSLVLRVQTKYGSYIWIHVVMYLGNSVMGPLGMECNQQEILCLNHVLNERDALETKRRENMETMLPNNHYRQGIFEQSHMIRDACIPTVVVDEGFMEPQVQVKTSIPRDRQQLMEKLKVIAMENKNKKPRMEEVKGAAVSYANIGHVQRGSGMESFLNTESNGSMLSSDGMGFTGLQVESYAINGPLTPPYSEDGRYDQMRSPASTYSSLGTSQAYTPPYSPPNSLDDASLFDVTVQGRNAAKVFNTKPSVKQENSALSTGYLPELDESAVENFFQDVECKKYPPNQMIRKPNCAPNQFLLENNYMTTTMSLELEDLSHNGSLMQMLSETQNEMPASGFPYTNSMLSTASYGEESFLDMIESPLSLKTINSSALQLLNTEHLMM